MIFDRAKLAIPRLVYYLRKQVVVAALSSISVRSAELGDRFPYDNRRDSAALDIDQK